MINKLYFVTIIIIILLLVANSAHKLLHRKGNYMDEKEGKYRELLYLEFSIIGRNSPFNNFEKRNDLTLLSLGRIRNVKYIMQKIINNNIEGDILEAGNWRGGSMLYARGILEAYNVKGKNIWMLDTFSGFPKDSQLFDSKEKTLLQGDIDAKMKSNSINKVKELFNIYNLSSGVNFIVGPFQYTIPRIEIPHLSYLRLDADSYANTKYLLENLYDKLSYNGFIELDDYFSYPGCRKAVSEFREKRKIINEIIYIYDNPGKDSKHEAIYWKK